MFRALLIDDEKMALVSLFHSLKWKKYGFSFVFTTTCPETALQLLENKLFDAVFVDIRMPKYSGFDVIKHCRKKGVLTEFVIVSGHSEFYYAKNALQLGAFDYLLKPVENADGIELLDKLSRHLFEKRRTADNDLLKEIIKSDNPFDGLTRCGLITANQYRLILIENESISYNDNEKILIKSAVYFLISKDKLLIIVPILENAGEILELNGKSFSEYICYKPGQLLTYISAILLGWDAGGEISLNDSFISMKNYIMNNYNQDISLQGLSSTLKLNYTYCSELFKENLSMTFSQFLVSIRMQKAAELLISTKKSVENISFLVGYNNYHYFTSVFKKYFKMTPSAYRMRKLSENSEE